MPRGIRVFARVHVFQVDDCLACGLVYHATAEFQKLLSILDVKNTSWQWLSDVQKSQLPFPRDILVKRCLIDPVLSLDIDACMHRGCCLVGSAEFCEPNGEVVLAGSLQQ